MGRYYAGGTRTLVARGCTTMDEHEATIGARLRQFRLRAGLSQAALAERANLSPAAVATLERGVRSAPYPRTLNVLAEVLGLSAAERAALSWCLEREPEAAVRLAGLLWPFWRMRAHYREGLEWLSRVLGRAPEETAAWARAALGAGILARDLGDMTTAHTHLAASLACSRALGESALAAWALRDLGQWHIQQGAYGPGRRCLRAGLAWARAAGDERGVAATLMIQAQVAAVGGAIRRAQVLNRASLAAARQAGDRWLICAILLQLGSLAVDHGDVEVALPLLEALRVAAHERQSPRGLAAALVDVGRVAHARGERTKATALLRDALRLRHGLGDRLGSLECLEVLAAVDACADPLHAAWLLGAAAAGRRVLGAPPSRRVQRDLAATVAAARAAASPGAFDAAEVAGARVPLEEAIAQVLADGRDPSTAPAAGAPASRDRPASRQGTV